MDRIHSWQIDSGYKLFFLFFLLFWTIITLLGIIGVSRKIFMLIMITQIVFFIGILSESLLVLLMHHPVIGENDEPSADLLTNHDLELHDFNSYDSFDVIEEEEEMKEKSEGSVSVNVFIPDNNAYLLRGDISAEEEDTTTRSLSLSSSSPLYFMPIYFPVILNSITNLFLFVHCCWIIKSSEGLFSPRDLIEMEASDCTLKTRSSKLPSKSNKKKKSHGRNRMSIQSNQSNKSSIEEDTDDFDDRNGVTMMMAIPIPEEDGIHHEREEENRRETYHNFNREDYPTDML